MTPPVVIIGGGIIGCCTALHLKCLGHDGYVTVVERDPAYRFASTTLSCASIRTQFATPVNVALSLYGAGVLAELAGEIGLVDRGYLVLATAATLPARRTALAMQRSLGARITELDPAALVARFPWIDAADTAMATYGEAHEGWFDAYALLMATRRAAQGLGVRFLAAEATAIHAAGDTITAVETASGERLPAAWCVNAAGPQSARVAAMLGVDIPVRARKRTVFRFKAPLDGSAMPMLFDTSGAWMRPDGNGFIAGIAPADDPDADGDFEPDHALFESLLWPILAARVPALEQLRLTGAWAGHYEMNLFDHNGIVGAPPKWPGFVHATGFSGHGVMHAPGIGRAVAEIILGLPATIDTSPLDFRRLATATPLLETAIY
ncbi:NAD(P)/FAD-dependent oxidoreductase [Sandarakinorhabdus sp. DWP1-3-1]|uniref:NAD(P)/FAD-dependent oxidoreductase n=1 Tax=Sandarakinorhabdus sp. DWP1-3-1 TaxID=2804627 RepID=UPI003CF7C734